MSILADILTAIGPVKVTVTRTRRRWSYAFVVVGSILPVVMAHLRGTLDTPLTVIAVVVGCVFLWVVRIICLMKD